MEKLLWEVSGVEYVYSTSREGEALVIVRFKVGESVEESLVRLTEKLRSNFDRIPHGVSAPLIKPRSIDDVPILALTFHGHSHLELRKIAAAVDDELKRIPDIAETKLIGGARRQIRVLLDPVQLASRGLSAPGVIPQIKYQNRQFRSGGLTTGNEEIIIETGAFLQTAEEVGAVVVGVYGGRPVYLREVAEIRDGAEESSKYVLFGTRERLSPAVTLTLAKRPGTNAIFIAEQALRKLESLKGYLIPSDVEVTNTRHYGATAQEKSDELLLHMAIAIVSVSLLFLGGISLLLVLAVSFVPLGTCQSKNASL
jgi:multidrug efflux pump subunit AcrB